MGFHVSFSEDELDVVHRLRSDPANIFRFEEAFGGYLLFLMTGEHREEIDWLRDHAVPLDSLTGDTIAFFVFSRRFPIRINPSGSERSMSRGRSIEIPLGEIVNCSQSSLNRLIKDGRCGWVSDGDELMAVTYSADQVAQEFGVLGEMPCVVVMDAIPRKEFLVHPLGSGNIHRFEAILRRAIDRFRAKPGCSAYIESLKRIAETSRNIKSIDAEVERLVQLKASVDRETHISSARKIYGDFKVALREARLKDFRRSMEQWLNLFSESGRERVVRAVSERAKLFQRLTETIKTLHYYAAELTWPLDPLRHENFTKLWRKHVCSLLPDLGAGAPTEKQVVVEAMSRLETLQTRSMEATLSELPSEDLLVEQVATRIDERHKRYDTEIERLLASRQTWQANQHHYVTLSAASACPSFIGIFRDFRGDFI